MFLYRGGGVRSLFIEHMYLYDKYTFIQYIYVCFVIFTPMSMIYFNLNYFQFQNVKIYQSFSSSICFISPSFGNSAAVKALSLVLSLLTPGRFQA